MSSPCCVDNALLCPKESSCSMILRSACAHGHFKKTLTIRSSLTQSERHLKRKLKNDFIHKSESATQFNIALGSSLKQLALKSSKTYSFLKENFRKKLEISKNKVFPTNVNGDKIKSGMDSTDFISESQLLCRQPVFLGSHSINNSDFNSKMSRVTRISRSSTSRSIRALSDSENEDPPASERNLRERSTRSLRSTTPSQNFAIDDSISHIQLETSDSHFLPSLTHNNSSAAIFNHSYQSSIGTPILSLQRDITSESPFIHITEVQFSTVDKIRRFLWKFVYLTVISVMNFDVWLLSRIHQFGKRKILFLSLLLLFLYICYHVFKEEEAISQLSVASKSIVKSLSFLTYLPFSFFTKSTAEDSSKTTCSNIFHKIPSISEVSGFFSNFFTSSNRVQKYSTDVVHSSSSDPEEIITSNHLLEQKISHLEKQIEHSLQFQKQYEKDKHLMEEISNIRVELKSLSSAIEQMQSLQKKDKEKYASHKDEENVILNTVNVKLQEMEYQLSALGTDRKCCDDKLSLADAKNILGSSTDSHSPFYAVMEKMNSKFATQEQRLADHNFLVEKINSMNKQGVMDISQIKQMIEDHIAPQMMSSFSSNSHGVVEPLTLDNVRKIIKEAFMLYDADKTGKVDYALESGGGSVLGTRCSESYIEKNGRLSIFGLSFWSHHNSPRTAIQPDVQPGRCWAFKGNHGFLVIQLSYSIFPTGFTVEHIPVSLSPTGTIDSAPNTFSVWGLESESDIEGILLGNYSYDQNGDPMQYFAIQNVSTRPVSYVELKIHSNHGNLEYTCLYRFRVHGNR